MLNFIPLRFHHWETAFESPTSPHPCDKKELFHQPIVPRGGRSRANLILLLSHGPLLFVMNNQRRLGGDDGFWSLEECFIALLFSFLSFYYPPMLVVLFTFPIPTIPVPSHSRSRFPLLSFLQFSLLPFLEFSLLPFLPFSLLPFRPFLLSIYHSHFYNFKSYHLHSPCVFPLLITFTTRLVSGGKGNVI